MAFLQEGGLSFTHQIVIENLYISETDLRAGDNMNKQKFPPLAHISPK